MWVPLNSGSGGVSEGAGGLWRASGCRGEFPVAGCGLGNEACRVLGTNPSLSSHSAHFLLPLLLSWEGTFTPGPARCWGARAEPCAGDAQTGAGSVLGTDPAPPPRLPRASLYGSHCARRFVVSLAGCVRDYDLLHG